MADFERSILFKIEFEGAQAAQDVSGVKKQFNDLAREVDDATDPVNRLKNAIDGLSDRLKIAGKVGNDLANEIEDITDPTRRAALANRAYAKTNKLVSNSANRLRDDIAALRIEAALAVGGIDNLNAIVGAGKFILAGAFTAGAAGAAALAKAVDVATDAISAYQKTTVGGVKATKELQKEQKELEVTFGGIIGGAGRADAAMNLWSLSLDQNAKRLVENRAELREWSTAITDAVVGAQQRIGGLLFVLELGIVRPLETIDALITSFRILGKTAIADVLISIKNLGVESKVLDDAIRQLVDTARELTERELFPLSNALQDVREDFFGMAEAAAAADSILAGLDPGTTFRIKDESKKAAKAMDDMSKAGEKLAADIEKQTEKINRDQEKALEKSRRAAEKRRRQAERARQKELRAEQAHARKVSSAIKAAQSARARAQKEALDEAQALQESRFSLFEREIEMSRSAEQTIAAGLTQTKARIKELGVEVEDTSLKLERATALFGAASPEVKDLAQDYDLLRTELAKLNTEVDAGRVVDIDALDRQKEQVDRVSEAWLNYGVSVASAAAQVATGQLTIKEAVGQSLQGLAQMMVQWGTFMVLTGTGASFIPGLQATSGAVGPGLALIGAGIALGAGASLLTESGSSSISGGAGSTSGAVSTEDPEEAFGREPGFAPAPSVREIKIFMDSRQVGAGVFGTLDDMVGQGQGRYIASTER